MRHMQKITGLNLKLLQTFVLVAEHRSFRKAADESLRSQSAVSAQIKELESQLGIRLFDRTTRRVSMTPEGADLLDYTKRAFSELAVGLVNLRKTQEAKKDRVRIACMPTITAGPVPSILAAFERIHPDVIVSVRELNNEDLIASVLNREVDFGVGVRIPFSECTFEPIALDEMCALVAEGIVDADVTEIDVADLIELPLFLLPQATLTLQVLENYARRMDKSLTIEHRLWQPQTMINMAAAGRGAAILPRIFIDGISVSAVRVLHIVNPTITRELSIVSRRGDHLTIHATALSDVVRRMIG